MDEIRSAVDALGRLAYHHREIDSAVEEYSAAQSNLAKKEAGFGAMLTEAEKILAANPGVEAVEIGFERVLVRNPDGKCSVMHLTHACALEVPPPEPEPEPEVLPPFRAKDYLDTVLSQARTLDGEGE